GQRAAVGGEGQGEGEADPAVGGGGEAHAGQAQGGGGALEPGDGQGEERQRDGRQRRHPVGQQPVGQGEGDDHLGVRIRGRRGAALEEVLPVAGDVTAGRAAGGQGQGCGRGQGGQTTGKAHGATLARAGGRLRQKTPRRVP